MRCAVATLRPTGTPLISSNSFHRVRHFARRANSRILSKPMSDPLTPGKAGGPRMVSTKASGSTVYETAFFGGPIQLDTTSKKEPAPTSNMDDAPIMVIVLNWHLPSCSLYLWEKAIYRVVADGGANRLYEEIPETLPSLPVERVRQRFVPDAIVGDLDSIRPHIRKFYEEQGVMIGDKSEDQDTTDLTKCINRCLEHMEEQGIEKHTVTIVCLGALGGRLDHTLGNLNVLMTFLDLKLVLCGDGNLTRALPAGKSLIRPDYSMEGPTCGLIPLTGPVIATTAGLRWNLDKTEMGFGGLVSTSNILESDEVMVESDGPLVWTTELKDKTFQLDT